MAWVVTGNIKGPKGDPGDQGPQGDPGPAGEDGAGIAFAGSVETYANLPSNLTAEDAGDGYLVQADGKLYIWDGNSFPADGAGVAFRGPKGDTGAKGDPGDPGADGAPGADGDTAYEIALANGFVGTEQEWLDSLVGPQGEPGTDGPRGSKWFVGTGAPGTISGSAAGDFYLDKTTGDVYELS